jgi:hypothetical protein
MPRVWLVIAHDDEARILEASSIEGPWIAHARMHAPTAHLPPGSLLDPSHGARGDDVDVAVRVSATDRVDERFAASLARALIDGESHRALRGSKRRQVMRVVCTRCRDGKSQSHARRYM